MRERVKDQELTFKKLFTRLDMKGLVLNTEKNWVEVIIPPSKVKESIRLGTLQEELSAEQNLNDNCFQNTAAQKLECAIQSKGAEFAVQEWAGGIARVTLPNDFHRYPDVGQVNVRHVNDSEDGMMIMKRDQVELPMVLVTGKMPHYFLMGWFMTGHAKQFIYRINLGRDEFGEGFLSEMENHEACTFSKQWLNPMITLSKELVNTPYISK